MRIIGGRYGGLHLTPVGKGDQAAHLRPTTDRVRESLFGLLDGGRFGSPIKGARVLDLFAGSGALGLEALSRGADQVCFVENGRPALKLLHANIDKLAAGSACRVLRRDARRLGAVDGAPFDLIFLDPPYGRALGPHALRAARDGGWVADKALILWEEAEVQDPPDGFRYLESKRYGDTCLTFLEVEDRRV